MKDNSEIISSILLKINAVLFFKKKPFQFDSGILSPVYVDNRLLISYPEERKIIINSLCRLIKKEFPKTQVVAGTATAGIPHAALVANELNLPMIYVRPKPKDHGRKSQIEGALKPGQKVIIIEDLISTGNSSIKVANVIKKNGSKVLGVAAIYSHGMTESILNFKKAKLPLFYLTDTNKTAALGSRNNYINKDQLNLILKWLENPKQWWTK